MINDIEAVLKKVSYTNIEDTNYYRKDGIGVPRVTKVLSSILHEDYITTWANSLGFKHQDYKTTLQLAADKGTYSHEAIENWIKNTDDPEYNNIPMPCRDSVENVLQGFKYWWSRNKDRLEVIYIEKTLVCDYFGGTLDFLVKQGNDYTLIDFKTSNSISYKYCLQLAAYRYMLRVLEGIEVKNLLILQFNKSRPNCTEYYYDLSNPQYLAFFNECEIAFFSFVQSYYFRLIIESKYKNIKR